MSKKQSQETPSALKKEAKPLPPSRPKGTRSVLNHVLVESSIKIGDVSDKKIADFIDSADSEKSQE
ncbi:hypothetical protein HJ024_18270 [Vibrio parahaemolyticus]|nr:hypothetical protein [Vibrio parahaemolyticus]